MINELTILEINKEENLLNVVLHESYAIGRGAFALPPYVSTNAKRQLVTLDYLNEALASFSGGGGGAINTANGLSGDGSVGSPAILGGSTLTENALITLGGFAVAFGIGNNSIQVDDTGNSVQLLAGDGSNSTLITMNPDSINVNGLSSGSATSLLGLDSGNNIVLTFNLDLTGQQLSLGLGNNGLNIDDTDNTANIFAGDGTASANIGAQANEIIFQYSPTGSTQVSLLFNSSAMTVIDTVNQKGLETSSDYSANFTDNSYVTKAWVEANFVSSL